MAAVTDPFALRSLARQHANAAERLDAIVLPAVPQWIGVAAEVYRDRIEAVDRRRQALSDAHHSTDRALRDAAFQAQQHLDDRRWRAAQRDQAHDQVVRITALIEAELDHGYRKVLESQRAGQQVAHDRAVTAWKAAGRALDVLERAVARAIDDAADLEPLPSLARYLAQLPLPAFLAYKAQVAASMVPKDGLNWTDDGCSDRGAHTRADDVGACEKHDFIYRNPIEVAGSNSAAKALADKQFARDLAAQSPAWTWSNVLAAPNDPWSRAQTHALVGFLGVHTFGWPNANEASNKVKKSSNLEKPPSKSEKTARGT